MIQENRQFFKQIAQKLPAQLFLCNMEDRSSLHHDSRAMTKAEQSWALQVEKEQLALLFGLQRFHTYCCCNPDLTLETDHKALVNISKKALSSALKRLQRMLLRMQRYSYNLSLA